MSTVNFLFLHSGEQSRKLYCLLDRLRYMNSKVGYFDLIGQKIFLFDIFPYVKSLIPVTYLIYPYHAGVVTTNSEFHGHHRPLESYRARLD